MPSPTHFIVRFFAIFFVLVGFPMAMSESLAEEPVLVKAVITVGISTIYSGDVASARSHAIENSLVSAVAYASAELLPFDTLTEDFQVLNSILFTRTNEYIQGYKVLNTASSRRQYSVVVEAGILIERLKSQLSSAGILFLKEWLPKVLLFVAEQDMSDPLPKYWWGENNGLNPVFSENMMTTTLKDKGFDIMNHDRLFQDMILDEFRQISNLTREQVLILGTHYKADVVILGTSSVRTTFNRMGENVRSYDAHMTVRAFRTDTGAEIGSAEENYVAASDNDETGSSDALSGVGQLTGVRLADQMAIAWREKLKSLTGIDVYIKWKGNLSEYVELRRAIVAVPGVRRILPREMSGDEAVLTVDLEGSVKSLADALIIHPFSSFGINIFEISENHLSIELLPLETDAP